MKMNLNLDSCCVDISNKSSESINEIINEMNECQQDLLDNKQYKFSSFPNNDSIFGNLITNDSQKGNLIF